VGDHPACAGAALAGGAISANKMPRTARSRSALGATMIALLPPSSSRLRPKRAATRGPPRAMRVEPVADSRATRDRRPGLAQRRAAVEHLAQVGGAASPPPGRHPGRSAPAHARTAPACRVRSAASFRSASTHRIAADQRQRRVPGQTATGKLKALITPTRQRMPLLHHAVAGRSLAIVKPCSWRDRPTRSRRCRSSPAPRLASLSTLPASSVTSAASVALWLRNSSPSSRTSSRGAARARSPAQEGGLGAGDRRGHLAGAGGMHRAGRLAGDR